MLHLPVHRTAMPRRGIVILLPALISTLVSSSAMAESGPMASFDTLSTLNTEDQPVIWDDDVSDEQRQRALELFYKGNALAHEFLFDEAAVSYLAALDYWRHPGIHFNLSKAQVALAKPLAAYRSTEKAMEHGPGPLGEDPQTAEQNYIRMMRQKERLRQQLVEIAVERCHKGYTVYVDGELLPRGCQAVHIVVPGEIQIVAQRTQHRARVRTLTLARGDAQRYTLISERPMAPWKPWATIGTGTVLALTGAGLFGRAHLDNRSLRKRVQADCQAPDNCGGEEGADARRQSRRIKWQERLGSGAMIAGSTTLAIGVGLLLWNGKSDIRMKLVDTKAVSVTPTMGPGMAGVAGKLTF